MAISSKDKGKTWYNKSFSGDSVKIINVGSGYVQYMNLTGTASGTEGRMTTHDFEIKYKSSK